MERFKKLVVVDLRRGAKLGAGSENLLIHQQHDGRVRCHAQQTGRQTFEEAANSLVSEQTQIVKD